MNPQMSTTLSEKATFLQEIHPSDIYHRSLKATHHVRTLCHHLPRGCRMTLLRHCPIVRIPRYAATARMPRDTAFRIPVAGNVLFFGRLILIIQKFIIPL